MNKKATIALTLIGAGIGAGYACYYYAEPRFRLLHIDGGNKTFRYQFGKTRNYGSTNENSTIGSGLSKKYGLRIITENDKTFFKLYKNNKYLKDLHVINWKPALPAKPTVFV